MVDLLFFFRLRNLPIHIESAFGANRMRRNRRGTLRAVRSLNQFFVVVRTPGTCSGVAVFSFWDSHFRGKK
jgi:hypothetical protein